MALIRRRKGDSEQLLFSRGQGAVGSNSQKERSELLLPILMSSSEGEATH